MIGVSECSLRSYPQNLRSCISIIMLSSSLIGALICTSRSCIIENKAVQWVISSFPSFPDNLKSLYCKEALFRFDFCGLKKTVQAAYSLDESYGEKSTFPNKNEYNFRQSFKINFSVTTETSAKVYRACSLRICAVTKPSSNNINVAYVIARFSGTTGVSCDRWLQAHKFQMKITK